jgi:hypothetical protein
MDAVGWISGGVRDEDGLLMCSMILEEARLVCASLPWWLNSGASYGCHCAFYWNRRGVACMHFAGPACDLFEVRTVRPECNPSMSTVVRGMGFPSESG